MDHLTTSAENADPVDEDVDEDGKSDKEEGKDGKEEKDVGGESGFNAAN